MLVQEKVLMYDLHGTFSLLQMLLLLAD